MGEEMPRPVRCRVEMESFDAVEVADLPGMWVYPNAMSLVPIGRIEPDDGGGLIVEFSAAPTAGGSLKLLSGEGELRAVYQRKMYPGVLKVIAQGEVLLLEEEGAEPPPEGPATYAEAVAIDGEIEALQAKIKELRTRRNTCKVLRLVEVAQGGAGLHLARVDLHDMGGRKRANVSHKGGALWSVGGRFSPDEWRYEQCPTPESAALTLEALVSRHGFTLPIPAAEIVAMVEVVDE